MLLFLTRPAGVTASGAAPGLLAQLVARQQLRVDNPWGRWRHRLRREPVKTIPGTDSGSCSGSGSGLTESRIVNAIRDGPEDVRRQAPVVHRFLFSSLDLKILFHVFTKAALIQLNCISCHCFFYTTSFISFVTIKYATAKVAHSVKLPGLRSLKRGATELTRVRFPVTA